MTDFPSFSLVAALKGFLAANPSAGQIVMSGLAWEAIKGEAMRTMAQGVCIMDIQDGERSFNRVTVRLLGEPMLR